MWRRVLWSDEKKLNLHHPDGNEKVWRRAGEALLPECIYETHKFVGNSVMIWGALAGNGLRILHKIDGILTGDQYVHILDDLVRNAFNEFGNSLDYYQEDNDPKHGGLRGAKVTRAWFADNPDIIRLDWPPNSPDLNPIENMWRTLQKRVCKEKNRNAKNLFEIAEQIWNAIPTEEMRSLIDSMPRRVQAVISAKGGNTKY